MSQNYAKNLSSLFEKVSRDTWKRLKASSQLGISQNDMGSRVEILCIREKSEAMKWLTEYGRREE